jgi:hypothetical protein
MAHRVLPRVRGYNQMPADENFLIPKQRKPIMCCRFFSERTFGEIGVAWIVAG